MKTLQQHIKANKLPLISLDEKLKVNKDFKSVDYVDELIDEYIDKSEGQKLGISKKYGDEYIERILESLLDKKYYVNVYTKQREHIKKVFVDNINFESTYVFACGLYSSNVLWKRAEQAEKFVKQLYVSDPEILCTHERMSILCKKTDKHFVFFAGNVKHFSWLWISDNK